MTSRRLTNPTQIKVVAAFLAIYVVWGSTYLAIKVAVQTIPPLTAAGIRFLIAGTMVYSWARLRGAPSPSRSQRFNLAMLGALMFVPGYAALFWAERTVPSGIAAVLIATLPLWTVLVEAALVKGRQVTPGLIAALAMGFIGVLFLAQGGDGAGRAIPWLPSIAIVFGEMAWAVGSVITARLDMPGSSMVTSGAEMAVGGTLLLFCGGAFRRMASGDGADGGSADGNDLSHPRRLDRRLQRLYLAPRQDVRDTAIQLLVRESRRRTRTGIRVRRRAPHVARTLGLTARVGERRPCSTRHAAASRSTATCRARDKGADGSRSARRRARRGVTA